MRKRKRRAERNTADKRMARCAPGFSLKEEIMLLLMFIAMLCGHVLGIFYTLLWIDRGLSKYYERKHQ